MKNLLKRFLAIICEPELNTKRAFIRQEEKQGELKLFYLFLVGIFLHFIWYYEKKLQKKQQKKDVLCLS